MSSRLRRSASILTVLGLLSLGSGCAQLLGDDDSADCVPPTVTVCATMNGEPDNAATLLLDLATDQDDPISAAADGTGCASFDVEDLTYLVQATNEGMNCVSEWTTIEPATCGDTSITLELSAGCMDGG